MRHTIFKPSYTNMKNQSEISWQFPAHTPPQQLRNYNEQAMMTSQKPENLADVRGTN